VTRHRNAVQHFQDAGQHLRDGARDILARADDLTIGERTNAIAALAQDAQLAAALIRTLAEPGVPVAYDPLTSPDS
jgi:hypothetical protein